jgi:hypothetical protein
MILVNDKERLRVYAVPMDIEDIDRAVRSVMDNQLMRFSTPVAVAYGNDEFRHLKKVLVESEECECCGQALSFPEFKWARGKAVKLTAYVADILEL